MEQTIEKLQDLIVYIYDQFLDECIKKDIEFECFNMWYMYKDGNKIVDQNSINIALEIKKIVKQHRKK